MGGLLHLVQRGGDWAGLYNGQLFCAHETVNRCRYYVCLIAEMLQVSYSFHPNCGVDCNSFSLNSSSGRILAEANDFDRSQKNTYTLRIVAQDGAPSSLQGTSGPNQGDDDVYAIYTHVVSNNEATLAGVVLTSMY